MRDQANVLSSMCDLIMARTYRHSVIDGLGAALNMPLINGMSDAAHPVQILTDLYTILEKKGTLKGLKVAYMGEGTGNTCQDWLIGAASTGMHFVLAAPTTRRSSSCRTSTSACRISLLGRGAEAR